MYSAAEYTVRYDGDRPIAELITEILENALPEDGLLEGHTVFSDRDLPVEVVSSAHVIQISDRAPLDHIRRLENLREIYEAAQDLLNMEIRNAGLLEIEMQREQLNRVYDRFAMRFGPISNKFNHKLLDDSPALPFLLALEHSYQPLTNSVQKASIFQESTVRSLPAPEDIQNCNDALLFCLNQRGHVDIQFIAELTHLSEEQALAELGDRILWTPEGQWVASEVYLSGNIADKLDKANTMAGIEPRLKNTIQALQRAMPEPLKPGQIRARLGAGWIPAEYVCEFIEELLPGVRMQSTYIPKLGSWTLEVRRGFVPAENTSKHGTKRYSALALLEAGLNAKTPVVHDTVDEDGREKRVLNQQETIAAQAKLEELKTRFDTWLWQDAERAERLCQIYNARFNVFARSTYDGSHLTLPGLSKSLTLRALQKDAVWYGLQRQATLIGDEVGLGKTLTAIVNVMESIRLGAAHKALVVVPNHLTLDWRDAFLLAYPHARVYCAGKNDLKKGKRGEFLSRIATNRWDAVIVPQSSFKLLPVKPETLNAFIEAEIEELKDFLQRIKADKEVDRRARKEIEKAIKRFQAKLVNKSTMSKDSVRTITWDQLGLDMLVVDEFHCLPYEARVLTDRGLIAIGEIVAKRLRVRVKSVDLSTGEIKWMPVTGWINNPQSAPMVRIVHEKGGLECTANHKVWTEEAGYVEAGKLTKEHTLKNLPGMQQGVYIQSTRQGRAKTNPLFTRMPEKAWSLNGNKALPAVRSGIHVPFNGQTEQRQAEILREFVCFQMAHGATGTQGTDEGIYAENVGSLASGT
jgi:N12 class adenine-specific DNA methylase